MSISALNDLKCSDEEWQKILDDRKTIKQHLRTIKGSSNYRMGYGAGYEGYDPGDRELQNQDEIYPGYAKGVRDGLRDGEKAGVWTRDTSTKEGL